MSGNNNSNSYNKFKMNQQRKLAQKKKRQRRMLFVFAVFTVLVFILILIVKSIYSSVMTNINPPPTPIPIITEAGKILNTETEEPDATATAEPENTDILPDPETQNDILKFLDSYGSEKKVCYLTFDDGPNNSVTPKILDVLRKYNIKATFFQVGTMIEENTDVAQRVYEEGHLIGGHSYDHTYSKIYSDAHGFADEMNQCIKLIQKITGDDFFPLIRFPGGSFNSGTYGEKKQEFKKLLSSSGIYHCDWNALNGDAEGNSKTVEQLIERTKKSSEGKNQVVVLMHDSTTKKNTIAALPAIIEYFISEGYIFSTLDKPILE